MNSLKYNSYAFNFTTLVRCKIESEFYLLKFYGTDDRYVIWHVCHKTEHLQKNIYQGR